MDTYVVVLAVGAIDRLDVERWAKWLVQFEPVIRPVRIVGIEQLQLVSGGSLLGDVDANGDVAGA